MNLLATSSDPILSAQALDNKRLSKIITESAQILCTILRDDGVKNLPHKSIDENPIVRWAAETDANLYWVRRYHTALSQEYEYRGNKPHGHRLLEKVLSHVRIAKEPKTFLNAARNDLRGLDFTWHGDVHGAYQMYLSARWRNDKSAPRWNKRRSSPDFYDEIHPAIWGYMKSAIRKKLKGIIPCPCCGGTMKFRSPDDFECVEKNARGYCLLWKVIER